MAENGKTARKLEQDSIGDLIAGITSGNIVPMKPGDLGYMEQPSKEKPKSSKAPVTKQPRKNNQRLLLAGGGESPRRNGRSGSRR